MKLIRNRLSASAHALGSAILLILAITISQAAIADTVELMTGRSIEGKINEQTAETITVAVAGSDANQLAIPAGKVHAVVVGGKRTIVNRRPTRAEIEALIQKAGTTQPDWWDSVPLEYPNTLDLSWPKPKPGSPWDVQKNVGQYIWSVINENPGKWKMGVRFLHHLLTVNKDNPPGLTQAMEALGNSYQNLLQDHARAAFWRRKLQSRGSLNFNGTVRLAECYWRLGSPEMAATELAKAKQSTSPMIVKLWSEMGDLNKALSTGEALAKSGSAAQAYLAAGDACRLHGQFERAIDFYEKVLTAPEGRGHHGKLDKERARASIAAIRVFDTLDLKRISDGTYRSTSISYAGPLHLSVTVKDGRIESVSVTQHSDKQYFSAITETTRQIVEKQGVKDVDTVTSATVTSEAIINATAKALAEAMK